MVESSSAINARCASLIVQVKRLAVQCGVEAHLQPSVSHVGERTTNHLRSGVAASLHTPVRGYLQGEDVEFGHDVSGLSKLNYFWMHLAQQNRDKWTAPKMTPTSP